MESTLERERRGSGLPDTSTSTPSVSTRHEIPPPPPSPRKRWLRRRHRTAFAITVITLVWFSVLGMAMDAAIPHELINVDFRHGVAPFEVGAQPGVTYTHVDGTYRITRTTSGGGTWSRTSVGEFVRTAYVVGVRAEVVEVTDPETIVGVMCFGPPREGADGFGGYGFFVAPGGRFALGRSGVDGDILKEGTDTRIEAVNRVSIECARELNGDITVAGYANGLEVATASDPDGYGEYTYAGIGVASTGKGAEVRFTRVWARIQDEEWKP